MGYKWSFLKEERLEASETSHVMFQKGLVAFYKGSDAEVPRRLTPLQEVLFGSCSEALVCDCKPWGFRADCLKSQRQPGRFGIYGKAVDSQPRQQVKGSIWT